MLSSVSKGRKAGMCLLEKMRVLGKVHSGMNHRTVGCAFNVNKSTTNVK